MFYTKIDVNVVTKFDNFLSTVTSANLFDREKKKNSVVQSRAGN